MFENTENIIYKAVGRFDVPCAVAAFGNRNGDFYKKAFGYRRVYPDNIKPTGITPPGIFPESIKCETDTLFDLASLSKLVSTTMIALKLIEEGTLCLTDSIGFFFPSAPDDKRNITIKQLMTHTSGIKAHFHLEKVIKKPVPDDRDIINSILNMPLVHAPGEIVEYTCMGYILLGKILELITGKTLDMLAYKYVFEPLGMNHTGYNPKKDTRLLGMNSAVTEYNESCNGYIEGIVHDENARYQGGVSANAGVFSTVDDLIKFAVMLSNRGKYSNKIYLNKRTFELAITDHTPQKGDSRGLGFELYDGGLFPTGDLFSPLSYGHNGFTGTSLYVDRETGFFMIFLTNRVHFTRESSALYRLRRAVANSAISEYLRGM